MIRKNLSLRHVIKEPQEKGASVPSIFLLHGIGSNEDDLFGLAPHLDPRLCIISARAPLVMSPGSYAWFNIESRPEGFVADVQQATEAGFLLLKFIAEASSSYSLDPQQLYLMGFSQGAMMSLGLLLTLPHVAAGVVAMSGRCPKEVLTPAPAEAFAGKPVFVSHGIFDQVIPIEYGRATRDFLQELPVQLTYREYPAAHEVTSETIRDVNQWLSVCLEQEAK